MAGFNVLKHTHVMIGLPFLEWHDYLPPPGITPAKAGHICGGVLAAGPWGILTGKPNKTPTKTVETATSWGMSRGTDMGNLIPHYNLLPPAPPNLLLAVIIPTSGSKSHFGASSVLFEQGQAAFAVAVVVNFNLNCAGPTAPPLPSGLVIAAPQTVEVGVTMGDMISGFLHMGADLLIQFGLNRLFSGKIPFFGNAFSNWFGSFANRFLPSALQRFAEWGLPIVSKRLISFVLPGMAQQFVKSFLPTVITTLIGSPLGYSPSWSPVGGKGGGLEDTGHDAAQQAIDDLFEDPFIGDH